MPNVYIGKNTIVEMIVLLCRAYIGDDVKLEIIPLFIQMLQFIDCKIGSDCIIHAGTVIGSDGFGFANTKDGKYIKFIKMVMLKLEMMLKLVPNCTIDRAVFKTTKIDNGLE